MSAKKTTKSKAPEAKKAAKTPKANAKPKKLSALDAAAKVLGDAGNPMNCKEMIEAMAKKGLWTSPGGKTPHATLYSAILREVATKGKDARFKKTERGKFARTGAA
jgi:HB1, ASXL, restriction endonuclease HTH domain